MLTTQLDSQLCRQLELLVQFDDLEGWRETGAKHCVAWMVSELSISRTTASERLRVGRQLRALPVLRSLFRNGSLGWCKIRLLTRVADADNERLLARAALDATVSDVERFCEEYRWPKAEAATDEAGGENAQALERFNRRSFTWRKRSDGNIEMRLVLTADLAQNVLTSIEHCEDTLFKSSDGVQTQEEEESVEHAQNHPEHSPNPTLCEQPTASQRRADAVVMMAERSLAHAGEDILRADRYQVVVTVDADTLSDRSVMTKTYSTATERPSTPVDLSRQCEAVISKSTVTNKPVIPPLRPIVEQTGPIATSTAQRIACDCRLFGVVSSHGEPISIGRQTRLWPAAMRRAILARDRHCQFSGCHSIHNLSLHHIVSWMHGGETSVENGMALCQRHHTMVHEGGYQITRRNRVKRAFDFHDSGRDSSACRHDDLSASTSTTLSPEEDLRGDSALAELADQLLPTRRRFDFKGPFRSASGLRACTAVSGSSEARV